MTDRDQQLIELTHRYRLGTNAAYRRMVFAQQSLNAVSKVTARLCQQGWLHRYPLIPPEDYFTVGPLAVKQFGYSPRHTEPLGPQALPIDYAVLLYAMHGERSRLQSSELPTWLPDACRHSPYCRTTGGVLELIRVDLGGTPQHVARKAAVDCARRLEQPEFVELVHAERFQLVVLTTTVGKGRLIRQSLETMTWDIAVRLHLTAIPRLTLLHLHSGG
jgi:hypothetical protein